MTSFSLRNVLIVCGLLFVLALGFLILVDGRQAAAVLNLFWSQSVVSKLAWAVIVLVPLFGRLAGRDVGEATPGGAGARIAP